MQACELYQNRYEDCTFQGGFTVTGSAMVAVAGAPFNLMPRPDYVMFTCSEIDCPPRSFWGLDSGICDGSISRPI